MKIEKGSRLVMIGDSITDCGRERPVGYAWCIGEGYVKYVDALLGAVYPERGVQVLNTGVGGDTVRHLKARWNSDVFALEPDWLSVMIGTNDVWRYFDSKDAASAVLPDEYENTLNELLSATRPRVKGMVVMTPFFIEPNKTEPMRERMDQYGAIAAKVAERNGAIFVDTQAAFDRAMEWVHPYTFAGDRVHPNAAGHMVLARAFLKGIEFEF